MNKLYIFPNPTKESIVNALPWITERLSKLGFELYMDEESSHFLSDKSLVTVAEEQQALSLCDCVLIVGGDGTILHSAERVARSGKPILGINLGNVGFLSELEINELDLITCLKEDKYRIDERTMLEVSVTDEQGNLKYSKVLLNEAAVMRTMLGRTVDISVYVNEKDTMEFSADGVIVSSPTGTTAYSLSAGGPILAPSCNCIVVTPICAHALNIKSVVLPDTNRITVLVDAKKSKAFLSADGYSPVMLCNGDRINVKKSELKLLLARIKETGFYDTMSNKLTRGRKIR